MNGPRILLGVLAVAGLSLWAALAGDGDADLERGLHETDRAFAAVDQELADLEADFRALTEQGPMLGLREEHARVRELLTDLRDERVAIESDPAVDRRARLPRLLALAERADEALALAVGLRRKCHALSSLRRAKQPVLDEALRLQERIDARRPAEGEAATHAAQLASGLAELSQRLMLAEQLIRTNTAQGAQFGDNALAELRQLVERQRALLDSLPSAGP